MRPKYPVPKLRGPKLGHLKLLTHDQLTSILDQKMKREYHRFAPPINVVMDVGTNQLTVARVEPGVYVIKVMWFTNENAKLFEETMSNAGLPAQLISKEPLDLIRKSYVGGDEVLYRLPFDEQFNMLAVCIIALAAFRYTMRNYTRGV